MGVFKVLMWKHCVVRKRRFVQTFVELAIPLSLTLGVFLLKDLILRKTGGNVATDSGFAELTFSLDSAKPPYGIIFTPSSNVSLRLMDEVTATLTGPNSSEWHWHPKSLAFTNVSMAVEALMLICAVNKTNTGFAMVEFEDMEGPELPDVLKYTIRMSHLWTPEPKVKCERLFEKFESVPETFLALQWAIDSSYLKLRPNNGRPLPKVIFEPLEVPLKPTLNKTYLSTVFYLLTYVFFGAPLLPFVFLMNRLMEERATGIQELVKMVGVTPTMLGVTQFLNTLPACLIFCFGSVILLKSTDAPMVPATSAAILLMSMFFHFMSLIAMAYACSHISSDAQNTVSISLFTYIGLWIPIRLLGAQSSSDVTLFFLGLCPHCPTYWFLNEVLVAEVRYETGIQFDKWSDHFSTYYDGGRNGSVLASITMQIVHTTIFYTLSWFLGKVRPGKYGIALPWNFLFTKQYWCSNKKKVSEVTDDATEPYDPEYQRYFEEPPRQMIAGIRIQHVSKIFGSGKNQFQALNNVTLDIYKGEITVLLGHNGAGKTTLISIITGMISPTSGKVYVNGLDTVTQQAEVRRHLSYCPQHNLFFPDLTVLEHLMFFSLIKGGTFHEAKLAAYSLMDQLDLIAQVNKKATALSGGLLRRLQLACALCGNADVLVLDEPTSGLDVEARRELWDTLLNLRGDRTLIVTTHFMEEADVLGDRLAALHLGKLRCHATPMFLKRAIGSGFQVKITTLNEPDEAKISQTLKEKAEGIFLKERSLNTLVYGLPTGTDLPKLFTLIEAKKAMLDIKSLAVGVTTLEDVFLELCCDVDMEQKEDEIAMVAPIQFKYVTGCLLLCRQTRELFRRQIDYTWSKKYAFLFLHIIMPMVLCTSLTQIFNVLDIEKNQELSMNLDMYSETGLRKAAYNIKNADMGMKAIAEVKYSYPKYEFTKLEDIAFAHSLRMAELSGGTFDWASYVMGLTINDTEARILYVPGLKHSAPVGLNLLSNIMSVQMQPRAHGKSIVTKITNFFPMLSKPYYVPKSKINCSLFAIFNICTIIAATVSDISLPCKERATIARHTHIMAGCSPALYWLVTFLFHMICYICFCCSACLIAAAFFDKDKTISDKETLVAIFAVLILSGMNTFAFMYFITFLFTERTASLVIVALLVVFGFVAPLLLMALEDLRPGFEETLYAKILNAIGHIIPVYMFAKAFVSATDISRFNSFCKNNFDKCPNLYYTKGFDSKVCCKHGSEKRGPFNHFTYDNYGIGRPMVVIAVQIVCLSSLVLLLEYGVFNRFWNRMSLCCKFMYPRRRYSCPKVKQERVYVKENVDKLLTQMTDTPDTLIVERAWKVYTDCCGHRTFALRGASFSVKKGECFGILGLNGAGKTTTFKLISKEQCLTRGRIFVKGHFINSSQYLHNLGYCPQFCGLDDFRTGRANVRMLLIFRGLSDEDVKRETAAWLEVVGMTQHAGRVVSGYSGGMVRRLATGAALSGGGALSLLDEPTAGVDTAARRLVWAALASGLRHDRAIAMSSHCMDEMERLCHRVTILSVGEMSVLGSPQALKEQYAPGHTVVIKLKADMAEGATGHHIIKQLSSEIERKFNCTRKDIHLTSLHYRINERLPYSEIFTKMEELVAAFQDLVEDYSVSDSTLEDVFLAFATEHRMPVSVSTDSDR